MTLTLMTNSSLDIPNTPSDQPSEPSKDANGAPSDGNLSFAQSLAAIKKSRLYSLAEMAKVVHVASDTLDGWLYKGKEPSGARQAQVLAYLQHMSLPPSVRMRWQMESRHGLTWEGAKRRWRLRFTVDTGAKTVGKRVTASIKHADPEVAIATRHAILDVVAQLGLKVKPRFQKRK